jgi:hypothetical protein
MWSARSSGIRCERGGILGDTFESEHGGLAVVERPHTRHAKASGKDEPETFYESAMSKSPTILTPTEQRQLSMIQAEADSDPRAYLEACRRRAR